MNKAEHIKYQLQTLASYEPKDLDHPVFEVAYENESGSEGFLEVCCVDLAERTLDRIAELEEALRGLVDLYVSNKDTEHEFISCITPKGAGQMSFKERRSCKVWRAFDDARELLDN